MGCQNRYFSPEPLGYWRDFWDVGLRSGDTYRRDFRSTSSPKSCMLSKIRLSCITSRDRSHAPIRAVVFLTSADDIAKIANCWLYASLNGWTSIRLSVVNGLELPSLIAKRNSYVFLRRRWLIKRTSSFVLRPARMRLSFIKMLLFAVNWWMSLHFGA